MNKQQLTLILKKKKFTKKDIITLLSIKDKKLLEILYTKANEVRKKYIGDEVHIRGIIEFSNICKNNCNYCGIRKDNKHFKRYRMTPEEIVNISLNVKRLGYGSIVLQSGEDDYYTKEIICNIIKNIKLETDSAIVLSIGERPLSDYKKFKEAGADRVLLRFETSNDRLYKKIHNKTSATKKSLQKRINMIKQLKKIGYQIGAGPIIGLPGQTINDLADDILLFDKLKINMATMGPYICHDDTPLKGSKDGTVEDTLKMIAITRIVCKDIFIPATTALQTLDKASGRQKALKAGANILMPNITPKEYRKHYLLYPNKVCIDESPEDCALCIRSVIKSVKRTIGKGNGEPIRKILGEKNVS